MANRYWKQFFYSFTNQLVGLHGYADLVQPVLAAVTGQGITYTAVALGTAGNGITVTIVGGGTAGAEVVTVVGQAIQVQVESGVSTRTQVKTAIDGSAPAAALVTVGVVSGGTAVTAASAVTTTGGVNGVSSFYAPGVDSIEHTGTGLFTITLQDGYKGGLLSFNPTLLAASAVDLVPQMVSQDVVSAKTIVLRLNTGATPTNPSAAARLYFSMRLNNSTVRT